MEWYLGQVQRMHRQASSGARKDQSEPVFLDPNLAARNSEVFLHVKLYKQDSADPSLFQKGGYEADEFDVISFLAVVAKISLSAKTVDSADGHHQVFMLCAQDSNSIRDLMPKHGFVGAREAPGAAANVCCEIGPGLQPTPSRHQRHSSWEETPTRVPSVSTGRRFPSRANRTAVNLLALQQQHAV